MIDLSRATSIVLIIVYFLYLWTQIRSEKYAYKPLIQFDDPEEPAMVDSVELGRATAHRQTLSYPRTPLASPPLLSLSDSKSYDCFDGSVVGSSYCTPAVSMMNKLAAVMDVVFTSSLAQKTVPVLFLVASTALISRPWLVSSYFPLLEMLQNWFPASCLRRANKLT
jgi:Ca2+:H+ antiporter